MENNKQKICIALPTTGSIKTDTFVSIIRLIKNLKIDWIIITQTSSILHESRNILVKRAIEEGCTHLLFVDTDMKFNPDALEKLLKYDKDIIGALYHAKTLPKVVTSKSEAEGFKIWEQHGDLIKCAGVATGFMLIKLSVFSELPKPWFFYEHKENGDFDYGEDMYFCKKAREAGFEIWINPEVEMGHIGNFTY